MGGHGRNGGVRAIAIGLVIAFGGAACSGTDQSSDLSASDAAAMVNKALGGAQAVQDFLVHLDMSVQTDDGLVSYYEEVLDAAVEGAADPVPLDGGFTFSAVDSLQDQTEQCSIVGDGRTGLIRSSSQLEWSSLDDAVLKANIGGQIVEVVGTVTVSGALADFAGLMPDGRAITASVNCSRGP